MRVALDLDGVVFDWDSSARALLEKHRSVKVPPSQHWDWVQRHVSPADWKWLWTEGVKLGLFKGRAPYDGALAGARLLMQICDLAIVTSRPASARRDTLSYLATYLPVPEVHILGGRPKSSVSADIYIDDSPLVVGELTENTDAAVIVFDRPWNQDVCTSERVTRAHGWEEAVSLVSASL